MAVSLPRRFEDVVQLFPEGHVPFGDDCPVNREVQAILFHHDVCKEDVKVLVAEEFFEIRALAKCKEKTRCKMQERIQIAQNFESRNKSFVTLKL